MRSALTAHKSIVYLLNIAIIGVIVYFVIETDSDKSPVIFMVFYPALAVLNLVIAIVLSLAGKPQAKIYRNVVIAMLVLLLPLLLVMLGS